MHILFSVKLSGKRSLIDEYPGFKLNLTMFKTCCFQSGGGVYPVQHNHKMVLCITVFPARVHYCKGVRLIHLPSLKRLASIHSEMLQTR